MIKRLLKYITFTFLFIIIISLFSLGIYLYKLNQELPSIKELKNYKYKTPTTIYDSNNKVIAELGKEIRYPVKLNKIPNDLINALVAVEDSRFYEHEGIDFLSIIRAFFANLRAGRIVEGGSTLTQQLVKVIYLSPEKKLKRKVKEAILAYKLDKFLSKQEILELYLNEVYLGRGAYGVQAAAKFYFGKDVSELNLAECALIASLPKAPGYYAPHLHHDRALERRNYALLRMYEEGYVTESEYKDATRQPVRIIEERPQRIKMAEYFIEFILDYLKEKLGVNNIGNGGYKIYTTINREYQLKAGRVNRINLFNISKRQGYMGPITNISENDYKNRLDKYKYLENYDIKIAKAEEVEKNFVYIVIDDKKEKLDIRQNKWARPVNSSMRSLEDFRLILKKGDFILVYNSGGTTYLYQEPKIEGALLAINPLNGDILTMVGGFNFNKSMFNRAVMSKRQVGSLFKPLVYATAVDNGFDLTYQIFDAPVIKKATIDEYWKPENFEERFYGFTTLKRGLIKSRNIVTVKLADKLGVNRIIEYAKKFGISSEFNRDLSISLGSSAISLKEMVYAYSAFPNKGEIYKMRPIRYVLDSGGKEIYSEKPKIKYKPIKESTAHIMVDALIDVVENGTGRKAKHIPRFIGGKTGSTNNYRDAWFIGFLPNLVVGVWVGFDDFSSIGPLETGARAALPAFVDFMESVLDDVDYKTFPTSKNVTYYKVDKKTYKKTEAINVPFTFEPYADDMPNEIAN
ncbi:MAG: PBP1A family penicillin-binding protein [Deferribacterota bacterium]|nr:PBP1A family penicillin-binding protein [Deferribacterota bacterium]